MPRILIDDRISGAGQQPLARAIRQFMGDEHHIARAAGCLQRRLNAAIAGPRIVEPGKIRMALQHIRHQPAVRGVIVPPLARRQQGQPLLFIGHNLLETEKCRSV